MTERPDPVDSPYARALGVVVDSTDEHGIRLRLPFRAENSNPGDALHGGCAASLGVIGAQALARASLGEQTGPLHTAAIQVDYLAAAVGVAVTSSTRLLRRGRTVCFTDTLVETDDGTPVAQISAMVRGRMGAPDAEPTPAVGDDGATDPGPMGPFVGSLAFTAARGLEVEHMAGGRSRITMPLTDANADVDGAQHEGAVLALLDTTGAMAAWAETGPGPYAASTPALQARILVPPVPDDLVGYGRVVRRDGDAFWTDVEIATATTGHAVAHGNVMYRIVT